jgi:TPR repeat protein/formylglycine-generating enzyme required for sulfatase activity
MSNLIESLLEPGIQKAISSAAIHLNENTRDELLGPSLVRFAKSGTGKTLLTLAVYSDSLRIVFDTLLADGKITAKEVEVSKSFLAKAAASYAKVRRQYAPFASLKDAEIIPFLKMYQRDTGSFGHLHTSTKWSGIAVCQNIAKKTGDSTALNTLRETLLKGAKALLLADGVDQKEVIYLKKLEEELLGKISAPKPVQNTSGMDSALDSIIQADFKAYEASNDSDEWIKGNCTRITSWQKAAELKDPRGQVLLGLCFIFGHGVKKNHNEGVKLQMKAAGQGLAAGQYNFGVCYSNGVGVQEDKKEAIKWYQLAAGQGYSRAQFNLAICYDEGAGVKEDKIEAVKWYRKAAEQGDRSAQAILGVFYENGFGVKEDKKEAVKWYRMAAEQGDAKAQFNLGTLYYNGEGVKEDKKEAVKWYRMAAEQGDVDAQYNLGTGYYNGEGVQEDKKEAVKWLRMAAEQGDEKSLEMLKNYNEDSNSEYEEDLSDDDSDSDSDSDYEDDEEDEDEDEDEDGIPNQLENFKTPRDLFRVATRIDAEELIEGSFSSLYDDVREKLIKHGIELEEDCIEEDVDTSEGVTTISYNDQEYILCNNDIEDSWERGAYVFFMIINSQIYDKNLKFYAVNGGNDLSGILLKKSEVARLMKSFPGDEDLPYIPEKPGSMNGEDNELDESNSDSDEDDELLPTSQRTHISTSRRLEPWGTIINSLGMKLVPIKPGSFMMGGREGEAGYNALEEQLHHVEITRPFYLGMFQVTQYEYITVMSDNPSVFNGYTRPVEHISWKQAVEFCAKLSLLPAEKSEGRFYRLPTEAEWEYACRAGSDTAFAYGNKLTALQALFCERVLSTPQPTMPVGMFPPNNWGLHDMHGNVWEWCSDWYQLDYYSKSPKADPKGPAKGSHHVLRGGSASVKAFECRSAIRGESMMDKPYSNSNVRFEAIGDFGLRVVCELRK